ncbi:hypothetical protein [Candidatus Nitrospira bockiana]
MTGPASEARERKWTWIIAGFVLVLSIASILWHTRPPKPAAAPRLDPAMVPLATGEESVDQLFTRGGCVVCHTIPGIPGADGKVGPKLVLGRTGPARLSDPGYRGEARTVREYIIESILAPGVYVVPGYPDFVMPRWYGRKLSAGALDKMGSYLESLVDDDTKP